MRLRAGNEWKNKCLQHSAARCIVPEMKRERITVNLLPKDAKKIRKIAVVNRRTHSQQIALLVEGFNGRHDDKGYPK